MTGLEDHKDKCSEDRDKRDWTTSQPASQENQGVVFCHCWLAKSDEIKEKGIGLNNRGETVDPREDWNGSGNEHMKCGRGFLLQDVNEFL